MSPGRASPPTSPAPDGTGSPARAAPRAGGVLALLALGVLLYLPGLGVEILRHPLEAKYALAAREMLRGSGLLVAHLFGELYPDKPPLYFWSTAAVGWLAGGRITETTARLPAVLSALAGLGLVWRLGADLFGARAGLVAGLVLATSNLFFWYARQGHPDQMLTAWILLACLGLWRVMRVPAGRAAHVWTAVAYGAMALGVLSKGLLGLLLPLLAAATYLGLTASLRQAPARLRLGPGLLVFLLVALGWYGPAVAQNGRAYAYETLVHQQVIRYAHTWVHQGPWYYYFGELTTGFFPWSLFLPGAIVLGWRARTEPPAGEAPAPGPFLLPLAWLVTGFVFFSLASSKRGAYLLPLYPAGALVVGWLWERSLSAAWRSRWVSAPLAVLAGVAVLLAALLALVPRTLIPGRMVDTMVPSDPWQRAAVSGLCLLGGLALWASWRRGRPATTLAVLVLVQAVGLLAVTVVRAPQYEARYPARELAARVRAALPPGEPLLSLLGDYDFILAFYLERPMTPLADPAALLAARVPDRPRYAVVDGDDEATLRGAGLERLVEGRLGPKRILLVRLAPGAR